MSRGVSNDAEGPFDAHGRILVTSEAVARVTRSSALAEAGLPHTGLVSFFC